MASDRVLLEIGDCFSIPLADGQFAFGQYIHFHPIYGCLIRVFDIRAAAPPTVEALASAGLLFPPIFVGLNPPVRMGRWRKIGSFPVKGFVFPKFRRTETRRAGINDDWVIWDGERVERIGLLSPEHLPLEITGIWAFGDVEERISTGRNKFGDGVC